ncbi:MAG TPA: hypothetical protein DCY13_05860 [Verrucomicrobiales bacterium]|nr:hypothetical protein [Verrucomicrobiales bacterium]
MSVSFSLRALLRLLAAMLCCAGAAPSLTAAEDLNARFDAANLLYEKGRHEEAGRAYEELLGEIRTAPLLFNAGNAWYKAGRKGRAVALWLQAESLEPRNGRIQINLEFARKSVAGGAVPVPAWPAQLKLLTLDEWALITMALVWTLFGSLALGTLKPAWRTALRTPSVLAFLALTACVTLLFITARDRQETTVAVVVTEEAVVRFGPLAESQSAFVARDGSEFRVTDAKDEWLRVEDAMGREGWLLTSQVIRLRAGQIVSGSTPAGQSAPLHARVETP